MSTRISKWAFANIIFISAASSSSAHPLHLSWLAWLLGCSLVYHWMDRVYIVVVGDAPKAESWTNERTSQVTDINIYINEAYQNLCAVFVWASIHVIPSHHQSSSSTSSRWWRAVVEAMAGINLTIYTFISLIYFYWEWQHTGQSMRVNNKLRQRVEIYGRLFVLKFALKQL